MSDSLHRGCFHSLLVEFDEQRGDVLALFLPCGDALLGIGLELPLLSVNSLFHDLRLFKFLVYFLFHLLPLYISLHSVVLAETLAPLSKLCVLFLLLCVELFVVLVPECLEVFVCYFIAFVLFVFTFVVELGELVHFVS